MEAFMWKNLRFKDLKTLSLICLNVPISLPIGETGLKNQRS